MAQYTLSGLGVAHEDVRRDVDRHENILSDHAKSINGLTVGQAVFGRTLAMYAAIGGVIGGLVATIATGLVVFFITHHHTATPVTPPPAASSTQTGAPR